MIISLEQSYVGDFSTQIIKSGAVSIQSKMKVSGFMPDQFYPNLEVIINGTNYVFDKPSINFNNHRTLLLNRTKIATKNNLWGNKVLISDSESNNQIEIKSVYNFFGKRTNPLPPVSVNHNAISYTLTQNIVNTQAPNSLPFIQNQNLRASIVGQFNQKSEYDFNLNVTLSSNPNIDTLLKLLIFNYLRSYATDLLVAKTINQIIPN